MGNRSFEGAHPIPEQAASEKALPASILETDPLYLYLLLLQQPIIELNNRRKKTHIFPEWKMMIIRYHFQSARNCKRCRNLQRA